MKHTLKTGGKRMTALLLILITVVSLFSGTALAAQVDEYHDPAEHWLTALDRTNELDVNSTVTYETFYCGVCKQNTSFIVWRTPEYSRDGVTAMSRNIRLSDGTCIDGVSTGIILDGTPGVDAYYTGYHWTKSCCETCGTMNSNGSLLASEFGKNVYWLYDCAAEFMEELDEIVTYEYTDETYHTKTTEGGSYCCFCYGTHHTTNSTLERHNIKKNILPQISNGRFAIVEKCEDCSYEKISYVAAKSVVADYYGTVDGEPHTLTVSDLSEAGVSTQIRYGNSAETCTMTSAPNYTEEGQYTVYYSITYSYGGESMTEDGVAYVWLHDESSCGCGCGNENCDCKDKDCDGNCCNTSCGDNHNFVLLETIDPTCNTLGYSRYACVDCGKVEKRDYTNALDHNWQSIVIREATCEDNGKVMNICKNCGVVSVESTSKGEHKYFSYKVEPTCTSPGYTVKECEICGDRHITDITSAKTHNYKAIVTPATCENGGYTLHLCDGCGSSFVTDYTDALGHSFDEGTQVTNATCDGEGVMEYRCVRCGYHRLEAISPEGHTPAADATCTEPQLCKDCGAVLQNALGHDYEATVTAPTCTAMGYTTNTCTRCEDSYKDNYTDALGHKESDWIVDVEPTTESEGKRHKECVNCGEVMETESIEKLYMVATTDTHGEAVVGEYLVIVTDTDTKNPIANATISLRTDNKISVRLPDSCIIDNADQTTVTVLMNEDKAPVEGMQVSVDDKNGNYCSEKTDQNGQITIPDGSSITNSDGKATVGWTDADGNDWTITVKVEDFETKRPIENAEVNVGKTGNITIVLPDGEDMDKNNRITVIVTDQKKNPLEDQSVIVKNDLGNTESGSTDEDGKLTVPAVVVTEEHGAYIYGYPDGTFGAERSMSRSEAAAIFARLLAEKKGDVISENGNFTTKFSDVPANAWYAGYVKYLSNYGIVLGYEDGTFRPENAISRAEFTAMAVRFFEDYGDGNPEIVEMYADFTDVSSGYWAAEYIYNASVYGWIYGYGDGTFHADTDITRVEVVALVNRMLGREADKEYISENLRFLNTFSDMPEAHWAYYAVMEAANAHTAVYNTEETWSK